MVAADVQYTNALRELEARFAEEKRELEARYMNAKRELNICFNVEVETWELLENALHPAFVHDYIEQTRVPPDLKIITSDGQVTLAHQYVLAYRSLYFKDKLYEGPVIMKQNDKKVIKEDSISKEALVLILQLLYCDECVAGPRMENYGREVMVASWLFKINFKHLILSAMKDSITLQNCDAVWKAIDTCETTYNDDFYSHPMHGLKDKCKEFMQECPL